MPNKADERKFPAIVKDNVDPKMLGRVQIFIPHVMDGWTPSHYPWARMSRDGGTGGAKTHGSSVIPEKDSIVWAWSERWLYKKNWFFEQDVHLDSMNPHKLFLTHIAPVLTSQGLASQYPDIKFTYYKNGVCVFVSSNTVNKEFGIFQSAAGYIFGSPDGSNVIVNFPQVSFLGAIIAAGMTAPPSTPLTLLGSIMPSAPPEPAVLSIELTGLLTNLIAAINALSSGLASVGAVLTVGGIIPPGSGATATTDAGTAAGLATTAASELPDISSTNVIIN